jgi:thiosulfate/3-mercaptopyruvate sulfurtransferase
MASRLGQCIRLRLANRFHLAVQANMKLLIGRAERILGGMRIHNSFLVMTAFLCGVLMIASAQSSMSAGNGAANSSAASATEVPTAQLIQPEELAGLVRSSKSPKPLMLQVGFRVLYVQAHIPGSEYVAASSSASGAQQLRERVQKLPRSKAIVLYCGCCPWSHCPNVQPAFDLLRGMGFTNVKVLFIAHDFGTDWVSKGYPVETGQ